MLIKAMKEQKKLPMKYQKITSYVGFTAVCFGSLLFASYFIEVVAWLEIDADTPIRSQGLPQVAKGLGFLFLFFIASIYTGVLCVAGSFSLFMCLIGKFTFKEAVLYTLISKFPRYWSNPYNAS